MNLVLKKKNKSAFVSYVLKRIARNKNFIMAITGGTGSGKSWASIKLGELIDPDFDERNICFTPQHFMQLVNGKIKPLKKGSVIVWDEMQVSLSNVEWQSLSAKLINYVLSTFRHKNFVLIISTPNFSFLNKTSRLLFHCRAETISIDKDRGVCSLKPLFLQVNQRDNKVYEKYLRIITEDGVVPFKKLKLGKPSKELIKKYELKKTAFTNKLNDEIEQELLALEDKKKPKNELTELQAEAVNYHKQGLSAAEIAELMQVTPQQVYTHLSYARKKGVEIEKKYVSTRLKRVSGARVNLTSKGGDNDE